MLNRYPFGVWVFFLGIFISLSFCFLFSGHALAQGSVPSVSTQPASVISQTKAMINGNINPNNAFTNVWFEYGLTQSLGSAAGFQNVGSGNSSVFVYALISGLEEGKTYYYRVVAQNINGITFGSIYSFKTNGDVYNPMSAPVYSYVPQTTPASNQSGLPSVGTSQATFINTNSAVLNGAVNPNNSYTSIWFDYGLSPSLEGGIVGYQTLPVLNSISNVAHALFGLKPDTVYYFRASAHNDYGTVRGGMLNFTTGKSQSVISQTVVSQSYPVVSVPVSKQVVTPIVKPAVTTGIQAQPRNNISLTSATGNPEPVLLGAGNLKPKPGEDFAYTVAFRNSGGNQMTGVSLRVILPEDVLYLNSSLPPSFEAGNMLIYNLGNTGANSGHAITINVRVSNSARPGSNLILTVVLEYVDPGGKNQIMNSYLTVQAGENEAEVFDNMTGAMAGLIGGLGGGPLLIWFALGTFVVWLIAYVVYRKYFKNGRNGNGNSLPPTVQ